MSDNRRDIELRIRATNLTTAEFAKVAQTIDQLRQNIDKEVEAANRGKIATDELRSSMARLEQAANALRNLSTLVDRFKNLEGNVRASQAQFDGASQKLAAYRAHLETLDKTTKENERTLTNFVKAVTSAEKSLENNRNRLAEVDNELRRLGVDTRNLAVVENELKVNADAVGVSMGKLNTALLDSAKNARLAREEAKRHSDELKANAEAQKAAAKAADEQKAALERVAEGTRRLIIQRKQEDERKKAEELKEEIRARKEQAAALEKVAEGTRKLTRERDAERAKEAAARLQDSVRQFNQEQEARRAQQQRDLASARIRDQEARDRATMAVRGTVTTPGMAGGIDPRSREAQRVGLLSPYQWQQLSFQINDIFTQLASGTSLTQTLAQQGGQIAQLFATNIGQMLRFLPQVAAAGAAVAVVFGTLNRAFADQASIREFNALLRINADGSRFNSAQITNLRREVQNLGMSWEDTGNVMKIAIAAGFRPELLREFATTVQNVVDATGAKAPEAAKAMAEAFTGGWEALRRFNQEHNFLLPNQYNEIRALYEEGRAAEGGARAWRIYRTSVKEAADDAVSPFTRLTRELSAAWRELMRTLAESDAVKSLVGFITGAIEGLTSLINRVDELKTKLNDPDFLPNVKAVIEFGLKYHPFSLAAQGTYWVGKKAAGLIGSATGMTEDEPVATAAVPTAPPGSERVTIKPTVKLDTPDLQALMSVMREASRNLPEGVSRLEITSGRDSRRSGTRNHPEGHAMDVALIDEQGRRIPGYMGIDSTGKYTAFAVVAKETVRKMYPSRVEEFEAGTQYGDQDSGHFGFRAGGARGSRGPIPDAQTLREQATARATNAQKELTKEIDKTVNADKTANRELQLQMKLNEEIARLQNDPKFKDAGDDAIKAEAARVVEIERLRLRHQDRQEAARDRLAEINDGAKAGEIKAAGERAYQEARRNGEENYQRLQDIRQAAEAEHRAKMQKSERERNELENLQNQLNSLARANELKNVSDIEAKVRAVTTQYERLGQQINKFSREFPNVDVSGIRAQATAEQAEAEQRAGAEARMAKLNTMQQDRNALMNTYNTLLEKGRMTQTEFEEKTRALFERTGAEIGKVADETEKWLATTDKIDATKLELYNAKIKEIRANSEYISPLWKKVKETIEESFTTGLSAAFNTVAEAVGGLIAKTKSWGDVLRSVKEAAMNFFAQLLKDIAMAILKYEALKLVSSFTGGGSGGGIGGILGSLFGGGASTAASGTAAAAATPALVAHSGLVVGYGRAPMRMVDASWFENAPRYHSGTVVGLGHNERAAVVQTGEEILTADNPRHIFNSKPTEVNIRSVLVDDPTRIPEAMSSAAGERAIMATVVKNMATIRQGVK